MKNNLSTKQKLFVGEYLTDLNGKQAAIRAGYSQKTAEFQASRLLRNDKVEIEIKREIKLRSERTKITADMVLKEFAKLGFSDIRKVIRWSKKIDPETFQTSNTVSLIPSDEIDDDTAATIESIKQGANGEISIKLHDKLAALVNLGKHLGMFDKKITGDGEESGITINIVNGRPLKQFFSGNDEISPCEKI